ncbi:hypothetical protein QPB19_003492 [Vibrio cholerae]|uniref:hypothetical protein n=1 Tax=Vibrio TaxID=662 RepID=UPI00148379DD|nr:MULTISPECIES: hypothetical protein [Vibrio]EJL6419985.1 hypothetical protein [Vibrio cholerae]EJL6427621.1 hypothetical protein [Vibrio cholerae]EJL6466988.1 hypothetical protein [Vibrio cholerae]EJL6705931.1 hypothetical protein [Vibrio cholerae]EJL9424145.1 hypothetical protein [Vibrio cholerae]
MAVKLSLVPVVFPELTRQEEKLGNGDFIRFMRFLNALFAPSQPVVKPVGKHNQMAHSSGDAAEALKLKQLAANVMAARVRLQDNFLSFRIV